MKKRSSQITLWNLSTQFLLIFLPLLLVMMGITIVLYVVEVRTERTRIESHESAIVPMLAHGIMSDFEAVFSDLLFLADMHELHEMLADNMLRDRKTLAGDFLSYTAKKQLYDQIRFLDDTGMEVVRVNFNQGEPSIVAEEGLQSKGGRYYFTEAFQQRRGEIYISPLDLNMEQGQIEEPLKPMIRFGTPVIDGSGRKRGIVLLNYFGAVLLRNLERVYINSPGQLMLLNRDGFWLKGPTPDHEWGFMYEDRHAHTSIAFKIIIQFVRDFFLNLRPVKPELDANLFGPP